MEFHAVRALEWDYNKAHNRQLKVFVHWDCEEQIIPFLRLVKEAVFADGDWREEHGNTFPPPERKEPCINAPIRNYFSRTLPEGTDLVLPGLEQQALEESVSRTIFPEPITVSILLPTHPEFEPAVGSEVYELLKYPFDDPTSQAWSGNGQIHGQSST